MRLLTVSYPDARKVRGVRFVDLRSPAEYASDHLPGAENVPLFTNEQRAVVGTLYKQVSRERAMEHGLEVAEDRLAEMIERILGRKIPRDEWQARFRMLSERLSKGEPVLNDLESAGELDSEPIVLHCWRGGMRSRSVVALLRNLGEDRVVHMEGGYKAYRAWVRDELAAFDRSTPFIVVRGPTGVGKTRILERIERELPGSTIDLEGLAQHRSSILGDIGLSPMGSRAFESGLAARLAEMGPPPWFVEGESRKVGDVVIPEPFFEAMECGVQVRVDASLEFRVGILGEDYLATPGSEAALRERLPFLENRLGPKWVGQLQTWLSEGEWRRVAEVLLEKYYDGRYSRSDRRRVWRAHLRADDPDLVAQLLEIRRPTTKVDSETPSLPCADSSA